VTSTSITSAADTRNSSTSTGRTYCPSAAITVIARPGMRTSNALIAEPFTMRKRSRSPRSNEPVQLAAGGAPFSK
jgi:hypothetical protein